MAINHRRQLTDEERAERRERDREYARQAVERLRSSEGWRAWLTTRATFHGYSAFIWIAGRQRCVVVRPCRRRHVPDGQLTRPEPSAGLCERA
jgi:hypothetical protein